MSISIELADVKKYIRISNDIDDSYITALIEMSKDLIKEQTGVTYTESDQVYNMAILLAVAHFYDKRESFSDKSAVAMPYTLNGLIQHLGMRGPKDE